MRSQRSLVFRSPGTTDRTSRLQSTGGAALSGAAKLARLSAARVSGFREMETEGADLERENPRQATPALTEFLASFSGLNHRRREFAFGGSDS